MQRVDQACLPITHHATPVNGLHSALEEIEK